MHDKAISIFGLSATLRAVPDVDVVEMSLIVDSGHALPGVFTCRRGDNLIVTKNASLHEFLSSLYRPPKVLRVLQIISDSIIVIIQWLVGILRAFTGSFFGFGGMGLFIVAMLFLALLAISLYAFVVALPFVLILILVRHIQNTAIKKESKALQRHVAEFYQSTFMTQPPSKDIANG
ncbi:MAG TPA: hypothetical protein EYN14_06205 [Alphaproteobacteria bacterium]|uniref:hypothetical protein n=1 Tax=Kordiimonas sp. TaxID=1970157 RepID=UPI001A12FC52|nr:hypothetical protein [Alphaproteobacteria bacterium]